MQLSGINLKAGMEIKNASVATFLVANAFVWYLGAFKFLQDSFTSNSLSLIIYVNILCLVSTAFLVTLLINKLAHRLVFLKYWVIVGLLFSASFVFLDLTNLFIALVTSGILGVYFGLGMPICMGYFAAITKSENRAKLSAIIILLIGVGFPILALIDSTQTLLVASALIAWRALALISLLTLKPPERIAEPKQTISYRSVIANKTFLLYLIPWVMFVLINELAMQVNAAYFIKLSQALSSNYLIIENILSGISAIVCGFIADKKGRKRIALIGFALLGVGYAALGIFNSNYYAYYAAWFYVFADGIAWGAFAMLFIVTLWGDIAQEKNSEKYYFIGVLPYLVLNFAGLSIGKVISDNLMEGTVFSFASFFLFIAILPLAYAPETLSDKIIRNIDLNSYVNKALEKVKKETAKNQKKQGSVRTTRNKNPKGSPEDAEARKLAEKYY